MRLSYRFAFVALLASAAPVAAAGQSPSDDADAREVRAYRLTMPKLKQLNQAGLETAKLRQVNPKYRGLAQKQRDLKALRDKEELTAAEQDRLDQLERELSEGEGEGEEGDTRSLSELVSRMQSDASLSAALRKFSLPPREAAVMMLALFQAGFTAEMLKSGTIKEIPKEANAENVKFYQANLAELKSLEGLSQEDVH